MPNRLKSETEKEMSGARTTRYALLFIWGIFGTIGAFCWLYGQYHLSLARASTEWPVVAGRIITSEVATHTDGEGTTYSDEIEYVYTVEGTEHQADVVVFGGHEYGRRVVEYYPLGSEVSVSFDPGNPSRAVLEPGGRTSSSLQTTGLAILIVVFFIATLFNFFLRRVSGEKKNLLDRTLILLSKAIYKTFFFPLKIIFLPLTMNLWVLGGIIGLAVLLAILNLNPTLTKASVLIGVLYGFPWAFMSWILLMGWLSDMVGSEDESVMAENQKADDRLIQKTLGYFENKNPKKELYVESEAEPDSGTDVKTTWPLITEEEKPKWEEPFCWKCMNHTAYEKGFKTINTSSGTSTRENKACMICGSKSLYAPAIFDFHYCFGMKPRAFPFQMGCLHLIFLLFILPCIILALEDDAPQDQIWRCLSLIGFFVALYAAIFLWSKFKYGAWKKWAKLRGWKEPSRAERIKKGQRMGKRMNEEAIRAIEVETQRYENEQKKGESTYKDDHLPEESEQ
jgi:hypothetical protein